MSHCPSNRIFSSFYRIFSEWKIRWIQAINPVSSRGGSSVLLASTARQYSRLACPTRTIKACHCLSSDSSKIEKQKFLTRRWGSLAWLGELQVLWFCMDYQIWYSDVKYSTIFCNESAIFGFVPMSYYYAETNEWSKDGKKQCCARD